MEPKNKEKFLKVGNGVKIGQYRFRVMEVKSRGRVGLRLIGEDEEVNTSRTRQTLQNILRK